MTRSSPQLKRYVSSSKVCPCKGCNGCVAVKTCGKCASRGAMRGFFQSLRRAPHRLNSMRVPGPHHRSQRSTSPSPSRRVPPVLSSESDTPWPSEGHARSSICLRGTRRADRSDSRSRWSSSPVRAARSVGPLAGPALRRDLRHVSQRTSCCKSVRGSWAIVASARRIDSTRAPPSRLNEHGVATANADGVLANEVVTRHERGGRRFPRGDASPLGHGRSFSCRRTARSRLRRCTSSPKRS